SLLWGAALWNGNDSICEARTEGLVLRLTFIGLFVLLVCRPGGSTVLRRFNFGHRRGRLRGAIHLIEFVYSIEVSPRNEGHQQPPHPMFMSYFVRDEETEFICKLDATEVDKCLYGFGVVARAYYGHVVPTCHRY